ncbi:hypothetical protein PAPYR_11474 [Paratrimastix pyriformis]|uniref:Uncharacterized protein n=1 Tax=Paratrimastix pyriformis TaxID=342808 RepID=A0ABQ8U9B6_9EUKA|nr:hypothetical protein PAPYR_11474 [Paratrimastix pyriformis]
MRCDLLIAQKDKSTAGTDMTCQILFDKFLDVSAVLRACCASVHSFLVWCDARCFMPALASTDAFFCLMLVLALRHAHSQHQDGYP